MLYCFAVAPVEGERHRGCKTKLASKEHSDTDEISANLGSFDARAVSLHSITTAQMAVKQFYRHDFLRL